MPSRRGTRGGQAAPALTPHERAYTDLGRLAEATYRLAGDVLAFDDTTLARISAAPGVAERIASLAQSAEVLARTLAKERADYLSGQLKRLRVAPTARGLKINVGSGGHPLKRWINIDLLPPAQLALNLRWGLPFRDGSAIVVFMSHVLEHFYYPNEALAIMKEIRRVLQPAGRVRVVVPDIEKWLVAYAAGDAAFFRSRKKVWPKASSGTRLEQLLLYTGSGKGAHPTYFFGHKAGYDFETLHTLLKRAGFVDIERSDFMTSRYKVLRIDNHSSVAGASFAGGRYSLFVEAAVPAGMTDPRVGGS